MLLSSRTFSYVQNTTLGKENAELCVSQIAWGESNQLRKMDFTLEVLTVFSNAVKRPLPSWTADSCRWSWDFHVSSRLPSWPAGHTAFHFGLHVGKALEMKALNQWDLHAVTSSFRSCPKAIKGFWPRGCESFCSWLGDQVLSGKIYEVGILCQVALEHLKVDCFVSGTALFLAHGRRPQNICWLKKAAKRIMVLMNV